MDPSRGSTLCVLSDLPIIMLRALFLMELCADFQYVVMGIPGHTH